MFDAASLRFASHLSRTIAMLRRLCIAVFMVPINLQTGLSKMRSTTASVRQFLCDEKMSNKQRQVGTCPPLVTSSCDPESSTPISSFCSDDYGCAGTMKCCPVQDLNYVTCLKLCVPPA
ncbi:Uncharacterised protein g6427 [Pycnogonum litorale]